MTRWLLVGALAVSACGDASRPAEAPAPKKLAEQRLHAAGELRLTSAGTAPRLKLRYHLAAGQHQGFRTRVVVKHEAAGQTSNLTTLLDWEREVTAVTAGWARAEVMVRKVRLARPPSIRDDVVRRLRALKLRFDVDARGRARVPETGSGLPASLSGTFVQHLTAPLPDDAVGPGATWERYEPVTVTLPKTSVRLRLGVRTRYTLALGLRQGRERFAEITSTTRLTALSAASAPTGPRVSGGGSGTGSLKLDLKRGTPVSARSELTLTLGLMEQGRTRTLKQTTTTTTRAVKLRPRPRPPRPTGSGPRPVPVWPQPATPG